MKNKYQLKFSVTKLTIENTNRKDFMNKLNDTPLLAYDVDTLIDGRKIYITKPGGKTAFGNMKITDFMVWIYDERTEEAWRIGYDEILNDLREKGKINPEETIKIYDALESVLNGKEPNEILKDTTFNNISGYSVDLLLKSLKWIWGQEDCNYPTKMGRMSVWDGLWIKKNNKLIYKEGIGMKGMRENLKRGIK